MTVRSTIAQPFAVIFLLGAFSLLVGCASDNVTQRTKLPYIDENAAPPPVPPSPVPPSPEVPRQPVQGNDKKLN